MKIKFEELKEQLLREFKGGKGIVKGRMVSDDLGKIMRLELAKGTSIGMHTHTTNSEMVYVIQGTATCTMNDDVEIVHAGECHYCPKESSHSIANNDAENLLLFCVVSHQ